jgi:hypothetical protein
MDAYDIDALEKVIYYVVWWQYDVGKRPSDHIAA